MSCRASTRAINTNECFDFEHAVHAVVRRVRCGLLRCKVTAGTADHGEHGESIL